MNKKNEESIKIAQSHIKSGIYLVLFLFLYPFLYLYLYPYLYHYYDFHIVLALICFSRKCVEEANDWKDRIKRYTNRNQYK